MISTNPFILPGQCAASGSYVLMQSGTSTIVGDQTLYIYDASGNIVYTESFTGNTVYNTTPYWLGLQPGNYTYTWESPLCSPPVYFNRTIQE